MALNVIYQNVRGLRGKLNEFNFRILSCDADLICITETWLNSQFTDAEIASGPYNTIRRDRDYLMSGTKMGGGCLVAYKNNLRVERLTDFETKMDVLEDIWVRIKLSDCDLYVCVVYCTIYNTQSSNGTLHGALQ